MPNPNARNLRQNMTDAELRLWHRLRRKHLQGHRFRRQHPIGPYIVDFICLKQKLIVEVDGSQHGEGLEKIRDEERSAWLQSRGYQILRFWNNDVLRDADAVLEVILDKLSECAE